MTKQLSIVLALAAALSPAAFAATAKPSITTFAPMKAKSGATVTITGKNLTGASKVEVDGMTATFKVVSATKITLKVPAKAKSGKLMVVTKRGSATSSASLSI
ncbi:MAG: IPT/TIG domain-containing protein [Actinobacteria bacterium]|nr:IPT/TIG domain-containing protein [Actinomycetota bacterium]MBV8396726.1 IPT/TIG domain-containing protein [Actinomycetota bacterium]MBV8599455.1 IPT/TIG domain-containing protein [Actinomycetota bacterium]